MITTNCPIPFSDSDCVLLAHGGGGRMTHQLISSIFYPAFRNPLLEQDHGGCVIGVVPKGVHIAPDSRWCIRTALLTKKNQQNRLI